MRIALAVTGSIAAYKAVEVARLLVKAGHSVIPMMTASAQRFVGPVTLSGICGRAVAIDMWDASFSGELHVAIADEVDAMLIVPATADVLARLAQGRGDDLVTATALCARGPIVVAPAMHPRMWSHPATQANVARLEQQGRTRLVGPVEGPVASGDVGMGRMAEPAEIVAALASALAAAATDTTAGLAGRHVVVSAGPTYEAIDPVRFIGNRSSGKMGFAIAAAARARGARVTLVAGPVALLTPAGVTRVDVESAEQMRAALAAALGDADALVMAAAVADFRPETTSASKIKKGDGAAPTIALTKNPDLLAEIGSSRAGPRPVLVGFALETGDDATVVAYAKDKLTRKRVDIVVANAAHESLGHADNRVAFIDASGASPFLAGSKERLAEELVDRIAARLGA
ncbi:MAG: bifunctional phosphopantothenoylcysteine decarboxylase/phosphopantothenate--cysteine ligase CoaBC [Labilithrix sp.]